MMIQYSPVAQTYIPITLVRKLNMLDEELKGIKKDPDGNFVMVVLFTKES